MSTADNNWWLTEAGEYVLGTLTGSERELFEKVLERDPDALAHVRFWEENFSAVEQLIQHKESSADANADIPDQIWENILAAIRNENAQARDRSASGKDHQGLKTQHLPPHVPDPTPSSPVEPVNDMRRSLRRSRWLTGLSMAATLVMGAFLLNQNFATKTDQTDSVATGVDATETSSEYDVIAVLRDDSGADLWAILAETTSGRIRSVALQAPTQNAENSHQLWIVLPDDSGVQPIGLLPYGSGNARVYLLDDAAQQARLSDGAAFAVSLEPAGGTAESAPTGDVISVGEYTRIKSSND